MTTTTATTALVSAAAIKTAPESIKIGYAEGDMKIKGSIRAEVTKILMAAVDALDVDTMSAAKALLDGLKVTKPAAPKINREALYAQKIADLQATVRSMIQNVPADLDSATVTKIIVTGGLTGSVVTKITESATKITTTGDRAPGRSLQEAFDSMEPGCYTVAQIMSETGLVSSGAISSRLFPKTGETTLTGVEALEVGDLDDEGNEMTARGARVL